LELKARIDKLLLVLLRVLSRCQLRPVIEYDCLVVVFRGFDLDDLPHIYKTGEIKNFILIHHLPTRQTSSYSGASSGPI
jgi:hypothetical protein